VVAGIFDPGIGTGDILCGTIVNAADSFVGNSCGGVSCLDWDVVFLSKKN